MPPPFHFAGTKHNRIRAYPEPSEVDCRTLSAHAAQNAFSFRSINSTECEADIAQR